MAGDWIKIDTILCDKPEVWQLAELLDLDPDAVVGKLVRLWSWMDQHLTGDGIVAVSPPQIDAIARRSGFFEALLKVDWLFWDGRKKIVSVPNWERHNGKTAKERALTRDRMKRSRDAASVTKASPEKRREEKRKEEEKKTPRSALPPADRHDGAPPALGQGAPMPSAAEPAETPALTRTPEQRASGLRHLSGLLRQVHPPSSETDAVREALAAKPPIPIPTDTETAHVQAAQA